jgi:hypothetical protein
VVRSRLATALIVAAVAALAVLVTRAFEGRSAQSAQQGNVIDASFRSRALGGPLALAVYLPPGYRTGHKRYPVIYFLHGLPASPVAYRQVGFLARTLDGLRARAILVAPQGARDGDSDPEYLDWGPGRNWETAIAREVPAYVDRHFRTIAKPSRTGASRVVGRRLRSRSARAPPSVGFLGRRVVERVPAPDESGGDSAAGCWVHRRKSSCERPHVRATATGRVPATPDLLRLLRWER